MATDYDTLGRAESDVVPEDALDEWTTRGHDSRSTVVDVDESDTAESFELPGADLSGEELSVRILPQQADEFTCTSCFLVHHRSRRAHTTSGHTICRDCAD